MSYYRFIGRAGWALGILLAVESRAHASVESADKTLSPYFFVEGGDPEVDRLPLEATEVDFTVTGVIADVTVRQRYKNAGSRPISARYIFPGSVNAAVHGMRMTVGQQVIEAEIRERETAAREFDEAKDAGKTASLLEQERPNVFSMQVANVMPGDEIAVELRYTELLVPTEGTYEFVYPTVVGPRYATSAEAESGEDGWVESPYFREDRGPSYRFALAGQLSTGVPIQRLSVPSHGVKEQWQEPNQVVVALPDSEQGGGDRDFVLRYELKGKQVESGLLLYEDTDRDERFFLLTVQPPKRLAPEAVPPREYVFVLDVSGSMHGFPLDTAKHLLRDLARGLRPRDRFNVMLFSGDSHLLWQRSRTATADNVEAALDLIDEQPGGGSTELLAALKRALSLPSAEGVSRSFVVVTDGYISAERDVFHFIRENLDRANVFAFGIGSGVNRYLVDGIAKAGLGEPFVILEPREAHATADRFRQYVAAPVLTDVTLQAEGFEVYAVEPQAIPDLLADRPLVIHGKWRGGRKGRLRVTGSAGSGPYEHVVELSSVTPSDDNAALARLWARTRIAQVADFSFGDETDAERALVTQLGLRYNLLTEHTSFIAVARGVRNPGGQSEDVDQPLPLPLGVSNLAVGDPMYGAPEPPLAWLFALAMLLLGLAHGARRRTARGAR